MPKDNNFSTIWDDLKKYFTLQIDYAKITATEKLIIILSAMAMVGIVGILGGIALFYLSSATVYLIDSFLDCTWGSYLIVSALMLIILAIIFSVRKSLIINPISRFISKLFLDPTK